MAAREEGLDFEEEHLLPETVEDRTSGGKLFQKKLLVKVVAVTIVGTAFLALPWMLYTMSPQGQTQLSRDAGPTLPLTLLTAAPVKAYEFSVCSGSGGSHGVNFRMHFAVYCVEHGIMGWVRNACNDCVYGQFTGTDSKVDYLKNMLSDPEQIKAELDHKAYNIVANVTRIADYPKPGCEVPSAYLETFSVDFSFATKCDTACGCRPTSYADCQESFPSDYTNCQQYPLGSKKHVLADCNSILRDSTAQHCFTINKGNFNSSGKCIGDWVNSTHAAKHCCAAPKQSFEYLRDGLLKAQAHANCSTFWSSAAYLGKCAGTE